MTISFSLLYEIVRYLRTENLKPEYWESKTSVLRIENLISKNQESLGPEDISVLGSSTMILVIYFKNKLFEVLFYLLNIIWTDSFWSGHVLHLYIHVILSSSVVVSLFTDAAEPGSKPGLCAGDEEGNFATKLKQQSGQLGHRDTLLNSYSCIALG